MSQLSRFVAVCAVASLSACSGSNQQVIDNLATARKDAGPDAKEAAADEDDWPWADSETPSAGEDAARTDAGSLEAGSVDAPDDAAVGNDDAASLVGDATTMDATAMDASGNGEDAASFDAGAPDAADATVDANVPDAAQLDAGDATAADTGSDAAVQGLRITLTRGGAPVPSASVFFHGVEDMVVATAETNGAGRAQTDLTVSKVTVLLPLPSENVSAQLFTYFNVRPGDDLKLELPPQAQRQDSYVVALPPDQGERYEVGGGLYGCARGSSADAREIWASNQPGCLAPTGNMLLVSQWRQNLDDGSYYPVGYGRVSGLAAPAPNAAPIRLGVDDYSDSLSPGRDVHLGLNGASVGLSLQTGLRAFWGEQGAALGFKGGTEYLSSNGSIEYLAPNFSFDAFLSTGYYFADQVYHRLQIRSASSQAPSTLELSHALPAIRDYTMESDTINAPRLYWTSEPSSARNAFLFETVLRIRGVDGERIFDAVWTGVTDSTASGAHLPPIPADVLPELSPSWRVSWEAARMSEVRSTQIDDYDAFRQQTLRYLPGGGDLVELRLSEPGEAEVVTWDHRS